MSYCQYSKLFTQPNKFREIIQIFRKLQSKTIIKFSFIEICVEGGLLQDEWTLEERI
jgi:hypothetical protein